jgi:hypothetical protein
MDQNISGWEKYNKHNVIQYIITLDIVHKKHELIPMKESMKSL